MYQPWGRSPVATVWRRMASAIEARSSASGISLCWIHLRPWRGDFPVGLLHRGDLLRSAHQGGGNAVDGDRDLVAGEVFPQAPEAGAGAVFVHRLHVGVPLAGPGRGTDHIRQEGLGRSIAVEHIVLAALLVVEDHLHRDIGAAGPLRIGRRAAVAEHVAGIAWSFFLLLSERSREGSFGQPLWASATPSFLCSLTRRSAPSNGAGCANVDQTVKYCGANPLGLAQIRVNSSDEQNRNGPMAGGGRLTTHVLDTMHGKPAAGMRFDLLMLHGDHTHHMISGVTNDDGRGPGPLLEGASISTRADTSWSSTSARISAAKGVELETPFLDMVPIALRDGRGRALSRAAAGLALRLLDLSGELMEREGLRFILNDEDVELTEITATETLLDYLRLTKRLRGSKEGCAEGDCGACTVLVGRMSGDELVYETVNACICFVGIAARHACGDDRGICRRPDGPLHPVQQAMVDYHGSAVRLLHAGHRDVAVWPVAARSRTRPCRRSRRRCRAISAAAPATRRSSGRARRCRPMPM